MVSRSLAPFRREQTDREPPSRATFWRRRVIVILAAFTFVYVMFMGITLVQYLTNPSYGVSMSARAAEWGRDHGLGEFVSWGEQQLYRFNPPKTGGHPPKGSFGSGPTNVKDPSTGHLPVPARLVSPAGTPLAGEGVWHVAGRTSSKGVPGVYVSFVRPDAVHTGYVAGLAWMDPTVLRATLYSGSYIPGGGPYANSSPITATASRTLVAAFNAGFRMEDSHGGYYTDSKVVIPLQAGAASAVIYADGTMTVGKWGRDVTLTSKVAQVRQNLILIVDGGHTVAGLNASDHKTWGATLGGSAYVWRSGLGVTANGAIVYVAGPTLSIKSLADLLVMAGCVRGMEMDINADWVQYSTYFAANGAMVNGGNGTSLLHNMAGSPSRYFTSWWNRDFFTMSLRP